MRRTRLMLLAVVLAVMTAAWAWAGEPPRNIVLFGWDGAQREHVQQCLERGELPTLKRLAIEGRLVDIDIRGTTDTKAGWTQILTGYDPDVTGVYSNGRFQAVPKGLSVFDRLKAAFGADKFACVSVIGKKQHCGEITPPSKVEITAEEAEKAKQAPARKAGKAKAAAEKPADAGVKGARGAEGAKAKAEKIVGQGRADVGQRIVEEGGKFYRVFPGSPYYYMKDACEEWHFALTKDEVVGTKAIEMLDKYKDKRFFFFVHFAEVDHLGHAHGENSKEYNGALVSNDAWTGKIIQKLKDLGLYDKTMVYVTADHGFDEDTTRHSKAPYVFLGTNDKGVCRNGDRADITPTILERFGLDLSKFNPPLAGHSLLRPLDKATAR
ncbi:MAG: hypothetical protein FJ288_07680 [Planctomycetes bacterium]|nr:hypothetical protein [Planctomycetota bacterium]